MEWLWPLFEPYVRKKFERQGIEDPNETDLHDAFLQLLGSVTITILVQEPWRGSVRFKGLDRLSAVDGMALFKDPEGYLFGRFGGGKYKINFHEGWNFVATRNFKPKGEPHWVDLPDMDY